MNAFLLGLLGGVIGLVAVGMLYLSFDACIRDRRGYGDNDWVTLGFIGLGLAGLSTFILGSL